MRKLPKKEFLREAYVHQKDLGASDEDARNFLVGLRGFTTSEGEIFLPRGVKSNTVLHELGHVAYGHQYSEDPSIYDTIFAEMEAESYEKQLKGKELDYKVGIPALMELVFSEGFEPKQAVYWVSLILQRDFDILVSNKEEKEMLRLAKRNF